MAERGRRSRLALVRRLSERIGRHLERRGLLVREIENGTLALDKNDDSTLDELRGHSITYRIALGPHAGRKAFTLQTLPSSGDDERPAARANGFLRHAGVVAAADQRDKLKQLCRYVRIGNIKDMVDRGHGCRGV